jgi:hypothetical protein
MIRALVVFALAGSVELRSLSPRAVNALGRHGIRTLEQARKTDAINLRSGERNCGRKTLEEAAHWRSRRVRIEHQLRAPVAAKHLPVAVKQ